jgi:OOP family OmpA-OmpF porin
VGPTGCPLDSDHDGVPDSLDQCPDTPQGTAVAPNDCPRPPAEKVSMTLAITFDTGKANVKPQYRDQIDSVVNFMKTYPTTTSEIEGHTDNVGSAKSNVALSQRRADALRKAIIAAGIDGSRLTAKGYGPGKPIADNASPEGRAKNRRVVATLTAAKD